MSFTVHAVSESGCHIQARELYFYMCNAGIRCVADTIKRLSILKFAKPRVSALWAMHTISAGKESKTIIIKFQYLS